MATYDLTSSIPSSSSLKKGDILNCPYSGNYKTITLSKGTYKLECWGAQGGSYSSYYGGYGGYSCGELTLTEDTVLYLYAGGQPATNSTSQSMSTGGYNGGGQGAVRYYSGTYSYGQGGGGGSDIRIGSTSLYARVIVAGGGGGSSSVNANTTKYGGGTSGGSPQSGFAGGATSAGTGGSFGTGASTYNSKLNYKYGSGGGGGGWYGGGAGNSSSYVNDNTTAYRNYNGGGSGYVYTSATASQYPSGCLLNANYYLTNASTKAGNTSITDYSGSTTTGHSGNGACRITVIKLPEEGGKTNYYIKTNENINLPEGFIQLPYIRSSGTQYINTDIYPTQNTRVVCTISEAPISNTGVIFGSRTSTSSSDRFGFLCSGEGFYRTDFYNNNNNYGTTVSYNDLLVIDKNNFITSLNNEKIIANTNGTFTGTYPLYLFAYNTAGAITAPSSITMYNCQIYESEELVRNFIPTLRISDYKAGLYDLVNSVFYTDIAGGNFLYNRNNYIDNNTIYYIKGNDVTTNLGQSGTITNNGTVSANEALYFNGSAKLTMSDSVTTGTNDWTIDYWEYQTGASTNSCIYHQLATTAGAHGLLLGYKNSGSSYQSLYASSDGSTWAISGVNTGNIKLNEWVHRAFVRKGNTLYAFENGELYTTINITFSIPKVANPTLGLYTYQNGTLYYFNGYVKHFRASNCARWINNFNPPSLKLGYGTQYVQAIDTYVKIPPNSINSFSEDFIPLKYIESSGSQYIKTDFIPNQDSAISIDVQCFGAHSGHAALCSARPTTSTSTYTIMIFLLSGTAWNVDRGGTASNRTAFSSVSLTDRITVDLNKHHMSFNKGEITHNFSSTETFTCGGPLCLLYDYSHSQYPMKARLYGCKIWDDDTLALNLVPALRKSDKKAGLYDLVNSIFYPDAAGGNFIYNLDNLNDNIVYYIKGDNPVVNLGSSGTITNSNVISVGNEFYFNGTNSYLTLSNNIITGTNDFTIDWWEYLPTTPSQSANIYHSNATANAGYGLTIGHFNPVANSSVYASSNGTSWDILNQFNLGTVKTKEWVHRAFVRKGSNFYGFENGKLISTATSSASIAANLSPTIGLYSYSSKVYLNGYIKDFKISNTPKWTYDFIPPQMSINNSWKQVENIYLKTLSSSEYIRLEYLEGTGTQYTDTGITPNQDTKTIIDCIFPTSSSGSYYLCGAREASYVGNYALQTTSGLYYSKHGTADATLSIPSITNRMYFIKDGNGFSADGYLGYNTPVEYTSPNSMYIFSCNSLGSPYGTTPAKIYRVQIYQDGINISRDMVPVLRKNDKKAGFYDLITKVFYPNLSTDDFNYVIGNEWEKI